MTEAELKRRVSERRKIPEQAWEILLQDGYVEDALFKDDYEHAVAFIIEEYDKHKAAFAETRDQRQTPDQERREVPVSLSGLELERQAAIEEYVAKRANSERGVRRFQGSVLGDRLLTAEQARQLVRSPAARFLEANTFEFAGGDVPLVGHRATLEGYEPKRGDDREVCHRAIVSVDPPGITETVENTFYDAPQLTPKRPRHEDGTDGQALYYVNEQGRARKVSVWERSPLEQLRVMSEPLAQRYRWEPAQATMFLLTGKVPTVPALKVGRYVRVCGMVRDGRTISTEYIDATVDIVASPWVSWETVKKAYRMAQIQLTGTSGGTPPRSKNLRLFRFVNKRLEPTSKPGYTRMPNGKSLVSEWNEAHPEWAYTDSVGDLNTRQFWRDYHRIKRTIAFGPPYQTGEFDPFSPRTDHS